MRITTNLACNPAECKTAASNNFDGVITRFLQDRERDLQPAHALANIGSMVITCQGLEYPEVTIKGRTGTSGETIIALCTAHISEAEVTIRRIES